MRFNWEELLLILFIALILFGPSRLTTLGKALGEAIRGFKDAVDGKEGSIPSVEAEPKDSGSVGKNKS